MKICYGSWYELGNPPETLADYSSNPTSMTELAKAMREYDPDGSKAIRIAEKYRD